MRKPVAIALAAACALACGAPKPRPPAGAVAITIKGRIENGPFVFGREDLAKLPRRAFRALDPRTGRTVAFEGVSLAPVLSDRIWLTPGADTAAVRGDDGYLAAVPLSAVRQLHPVLADRADGQPLRALRLVWPNLDWPGLESDPRARFWWVDGAVEVEVLAWEESLGRALRLPAGASDAARLGSDAFVTWCSSCHRVRGAGGRRGPELARPGSRASAARLGSHGAAEARRLGAAPPVEGAAERIASFLTAVEAAGPLPPAGAPKDPEAKEPVDGRPEGPRQGW